VRPSELQEPYNALIKKDTVGFWRESGRLSARRPDDGFVTGSRFAAPRCRHHRSNHDLPAADRPREKLLRKGAKALSDQELLAVLLGQGTPGMDVMALAAKLARLIDEKGLDVKAEDLSPPVTEIRLPTLPLIVVGVDLMSGKIRHGLSCHASSLGIIPLPPSQVRNHSDH
jgi:hypothetical protein